MGSTGFSDTQWKNYASLVASAFGMDATQAQTLVANTTAKLVCALPFLAGCHEPERTALAHLASFVLAGSDSARAHFDHKKEDDRDPLARLSVISHFEGGSPALIERGMKLLAIVMINGYRRDVRADSAAGEYNPVGAGVWNADQRISSLQADIASVPCAEMDALLTPSAAALSWWGGP